MAFAGNDLSASRASAHHQQAASRAAPAPGEPNNSARVQTEYSRGFGDWLISHQVGLVCSTYLTGYLLFIGVRADGLLLPSAASFSHAMGFAAASRRIYLGTKNEIWRLENILKPNELANEMFDRFYTPRAAHMTGDINIHELAVDGGGDVLFINTRHSCLATISATHAFKPLWKPKFISKLAPEDRCHLNVLAMEHGRARYVTACSTGDALESWRGGQRDAGVVIDIETDAIVAEGFSMPHSPRIRGDALYVLESGRGYLVRIDRHSGKREGRDVLPRLRPRHGLCVALRSHHPLASPPCRFRRPAAGCGDEGLGRRAPLRPAGHRSAQWRHRALVPVQGRRH
jgi:uncharacterized protein (TIGR03032 family)